MKTCCCFERVKDKFILIQKTITIRENGVSNLGVVDGDFLGGESDESDDEKYLFIYHKINNKNIKDELVMGNQTIQPSNKISYEPVHSPHSMLNNTFIFRVKNQEFIKSEWPFFSQKQFNSWQAKYKAFLLQLFEVQSLQKCKQSIVSNLFIPVSYSYTKVTVCSPTGIVTMNYQKVDSSLIELIEKKSKSNEPFLETQIWKIILNLTQTFAFLHARSIAIGDARSQNIVTDLGKNQVKISTELSWIGEKTFQEKLRTNQDIFLSPQMLQCQQIGKKISQQLLIDNDDFTLGLTLSECLLLQDLSKIYETKENFRSISKKRYAEVIEKILKIKYYSLKLKMVIIGMIQLEGDVRLRSRELFDLMRKCKNNILSDKDFNLTKEQFQGLLSHKYSALQKIMNQFKSKASRQMFENKELFTSRAITINGISTVRNLKRTYDDTFNLDLLDLSRQDQAIVPPKHLQLSAVDGNRSWSIDLKQNSFIAKHKCSDVREMHTQNSQFTPEKSTEKRKKQIRYLRLDDNMAESQVKELNSFKKQCLQPSLIPVTNYTLSEEKQYYYSPELKIYDGKDQETDNFSFHSPQSRFKMAKQNMLESNNKRSLLQAKSISNSSETLLLVPSVYAVSNPPQSYVSYHYSKSIQNKKHTKESFDQSEKQISLNLQGLLNLKALRKSSQPPQYNFASFGASQNHFRRQTVDAEVSHQPPSSLYLTRSEQKRKDTY